MNEGWVSLGSLWQVAEEVVGSLSYSISPHHLLYFNKWLQLGGQCEKSLLSYQGMNGIKIQMFLILTVGNNMVPQ